MESLFAYSYLWAFGFSSLHEYNRHLDELFLANPNDERLLELEECSNNCKDTFARLKWYFDCKSNTFDTDMFGKALF